MTFHAKPTTIDSIKKSLVALRMLRALEVLDATSLPARPLFISQATEPNPLAATTFPITRYANPLPGSSFVESGLAVCDHRNAGANAAFRTWQL
jgi:hypothetical protein